MLILVLVHPCTSELFMTLEYDTNGTARPTGTSFDFSLRTVEMHVTVLGCDHGYYAYTMQPLECRECVCDEFTDGRHEPFAQGGPAEIDSS